MQKNEPVANLAMMSVIMKNELNKIDKYHDQRLLKCLNLFDHVFKHLILYKNFAFKTFEKLTFLL